MALPTTPSSWMQSLEDMPSRLFGAGSDDYELYEEDGSFVLSVELPGFDPEEIDLRWHDGRLNVSAEHSDESLGRKKTYHRTFRFPKEIDEDGVTAEYENGVLTVRLPATGAFERGTKIDIEA